MLTQALHLAQALIRFPSITPNEAGSLTFIEHFLKPLGFQTQWHTFKDVSNLFATLGSGKMRVCFVGHVDVVPVGDKAAWSVDPFEAVIREEKLWGRGTADMKGAIACFLAAVEAFLKANTLPENNSISLLLTSDEEGPAVDGIQRLLPWLKTNHHVPDFFLIGEPTGQGHVGGEIKVGRRGSLTGYLRCEGKQGHIAYPDLADNPIPRMLKCLQTLQALPLDDGNPAFEPSKLQITSIDVGNQASNILPAKVEARFGIRFNNLQTASSLTSAIQTICQTHGGRHQLDLTHHGDAFLTQDPTVVYQVCQAVQAVMGKSPVCSTSGGTSDGRFLINLAPVIECGFPEDTIHQVDEHIALDDINHLTHIYHQLLKNLF